MSDYIIAAFNTSIIIIVITINSFLAQQKISDLEKKLDAILIIVSQPHKEVTK